MSSAHKSPTLVFDGISYRLERYTSGLRLRSRSVHHPVSYATGTFNVTLAKRKAREWLEDRKAAVPVKTTRTAEHLIEAYEGMAKRAGARSATYNVQMFRAVLRMVLGREAAAVRLHEITPALWTGYLARRQSLATVDLSSRKAEHVSYNTAVRAARCLLLESLREGYAAAGIKMPEAGRIQWLQEIVRVPAKYDDAAMLAAWEACEDRAIWWTVALARFAGLRRDEVMACRGGWLENVEGVWCVSVRDREEEGFFCKTGRPRLSPLLHGGVIEALRHVAVDAVAFVVPLDGARRQWFKAVPQRWLRDYMSSDDIHKPLHRLRAAYLDQVRRSEMMRLQEESVKASAKAGGHTSTGTTTKHYLPAQLRA